MRFWDASALVPLLVEEPLTRSVQRLYADDPRFKALELLPLHSLRAADALQLAAALVVAGPERSELQFVCLDGKLCGAASAEGLAVIGRAVLEGDELAEGQSL